MDTTNGIKDAQNVGYIIVKVSTARGAIPLNNASVSIRGGTPDTSGIIHSLSTDRDGLTPKTPLPAPARQLSENPGNPSPYSLWNIDVFKEGYIPVSFQNVPIYSSIVSVQPAVMVPASQSPYPQQIFNESSNPNL